MLAYKHTSILSNIYLLYSCNYEEQEQDWKNAFDDKSVDCDHEKIHTKGARAVPRWSPLPRRTPFPCSSVSSSPFSTSSPTRTMLRTSEIMLRQNLRPFQHCCGLNRRSDQEVRGHPFYGLQTIRRSKKLWKRQMQLQRVKSDNKENAVYKEEKPQRHHSTKQTDRKRCKFVSLNTLKSSS